MDVNSGSLSIFSSQTILYHHFLHCRMRSHTSFTHCKCSYHQRKISVSLITAPWTSSTSSTMTAHYPTITWEMKAKGLGSGIMLERHIPTIITQRWSGKISEWGLVVQEAWTWWWVCMRTSSTTLAAPFITVGSSGRVVFTWDSQSHNVARYMVSHFHHLTGGTRVVKKETS